MKKPVRDAAMVAFMIFGIPALVMLPFLLSGFIGVK